MIITEYEFKKVPVGEREIFIPEEPFYCFQTGIRRAVRIIPRLVDWDHPELKKGDVYKLDITCVYLSFECIIDRFDVSREDIEGHIRNPKNSTSKIGSICDMLIKEDYHKRTKKQFDQDLENAWYEINLIP